MFLPKKTLLACSLLIGGLSIATSDAAVQAPTASGLHSSTGAASGEIYAPSFFSIGRISGHMLDGAGTAFKCEGELSPTITSQWTGYAPMGTIYGTFEPVATIPGFPTIEFFGYYMVDTRGTGRFYAYMSVPPAVPGGSTQYVGAFAAHFRAASQFDPLTLIPIPGHFDGGWLLTK